MANNASKLSAFDAEKADRAAASIRPSWEFDQADFEAPAIPAAAPAPKIDAFDAKLAQAKPVALAKEAPFAGSEIPRDTVIDGMPTVAVGRTIDIGPAPVDAKPAKPERAPPPPRPQATRFGLGEDPAPSSAPTSATTAKGTHIMAATSPEGAALAAAAAAAGVGAPPPEPVIDAPATFSPGDVAEVAPLEPRAVSSPDALDGVGAIGEVPAADARPVSAPPPAPPAPVAPVAPSISRIEDPIEIPKKKGGPVAWLIGGAVAVAALVGGIVVATGGGDKPSGSEAASTSTSQAPAKTNAAPAEKPTEKPAPAPTTPATPTTATASATAEPSAAPTTSAIATSEPTAAPTAKPTAAPVAANPTPPKTGTTPPKQPPPKSTGGIRKDTPF